MSTSTDKITDAAIALSDAVTPAVRAAVADARAAGLPDVLIEAVLGRVVGYEIERER